MDKMTIGKPKYPDIQVKLTGKDGNAFMVLGLTQQSLAKAQVDEAKIDLFTKEATSGGYNNLLQTCMRWVDVI